MFNQITSRGTSVPYRALAVFFFTSFSFVFMSQALGSNNDTVVTITKCRKDGRCFRKRRRQLTGLFAESKRKRFFMVKCYPGMVTVNTIDNLRPQLYLVARDKVDPIPCKDVGFASGSEYDISWNYWSKYVWMG